MKKGEYNIEKILQKDSVPTKALNKLRFPFHRIFYFLYFSLANAFDLNQIVFWGFRFSVELCVNSLLKRELHHLVSEHIIEIHAIESSVFEISPHERIVIGVNGRDFHA